ncbi:hypothetical protein V8C34DRAFT_114521 [Trichoderma compactum]
MTAPHTWEMYVYIRKNLHQESTSLITTYHATRQDKENHSRGNLRGAMREPTTTVFSWQGRVLIIYFGFLSYLGLDLLCFSISLSFFLPPFFFILSLSFVTVVRYLAGRSDRASYLGTHERQDRDIPEFKKQVLVQFSMHLVHDCEYAGVYV